MRINKSLLRCRFRRAVETYDEQARVQRKTAEHLLNLMENEIDCSFKDVLEIGCSTGLLTRNLLKRHSRHIHSLCLNDIVDEFLLCVSRNIASYEIPCTLLAGDIEEVVLPGSFDLIISSSTFHWMEDLPALFVKLGHHLNPGGHLVFSMYGPENYREIREITGFGLSYRSSSEIQQLLTTFFTPIVSEESLEIQWFQNPMDVLRHCRKTGVNALFTLRWTKKKISIFNERYWEQFGKEESVSLTYHPLYMIAVKK